jgi:branched-chain amino acid transport system substrate-binding protein
MKSIRTAFWAGRICGATFALACLAVAASAEEAAPASSPAGAFSYAREHPAEYAGPGREAPEPPDLQEVLIGYLGPSGPSDPEGGDMWCAAQLAIEEANREGGCRGKPFRLVPVWSDRSWSSAAPLVARMAYGDRVWAIVGGIDGPSTHLAEQVAAKARLVLINAAATDKTVNLANVPWMFSCVPGDHLLAPVLAAGISGRIGKKPFLLVSTDDHDAHLFALELTKCLAERHVAPRHHIVCQRALRDVAELAAQVAGSKAEAVVLVAGAQDSARLVSAFRAAGFAGQIHGGPAMGRRRFVEEAGRAAEGVVFPLLYQPQAASAGFARTFRVRFGRPPDFAAAYTYDAVRLVVAAIDRAGLNRARIGDAVRALSPWTGVTGPMKWDLLGSNVRDVRLGTIRDGAVVPVEATDAARDAGGVR